MTNIDFTKSEQYTLSIRLSADGFSFSVHTLTNGECLFMDTFAVNTSYSLTANLKEMLASTSALQYRYKQTNILIDTPRFTTIPFELFEDEQTEELFYQNFAKSSHETILCNILGKSNVALLFGMDKYAHQLLCEHFPKVRIFACISPLTEFFAQQSQESSCRKLYAHIKKTSMEILAFEKGKLLIVNTFPCQHINDRIYYLLYIWQQLGFSQEKDQLWLAGDTKEEELLTELNKFLRQVNIQPAQGKLTFDIQTLMTCE